MAEMLGDLPQHLCLIGVQPVELDDFGGSLRDKVKDQIGPATDLVLEYLARFGIMPHRLLHPLPETATLSSPEFALALYEGERPSESDACRIGDPRVLAAAAAPTASEDA
jgi:hydrogenase maturation protease